MEEWRGMGKITVVVVVEVPQPYDSPYLSPAAIFQTSGPIKLMTKCPVFNIQMTYIYTPRFLLSSYLIKMCRTETSEKTDVSTTTPHAMETSSSIYYTDDEQCLFGFNELDIDPMWDEEFDTLHQASEPFGGSAIEIALSIDDIVQLDTMSEPRSPPQSMVFSILKILHSEF